MVSPHIVTPGATGTPSDIAASTDLLGESSRTKTHKGSEVTFLGRETVLAFVLIFLALRRAEDFMRKLAEAGHGRFRKYDPSTIIEKMQTLLPAPDGPIEMANPVSAVTSKPTSI